MATKLTWAQRAHLKGQIGTALKNEENLGEYLQGIGFKPMPKSAKGLKDGDLIIMVSVKNRSGFVCTVKQKWSRKNKVGDLMPIVPGRSVKTENVRFGTSLHKEKFLCKAI